MTGLPASACSLSTAAAGEPAYGSAAPARSWVALEQPGPWGHDAVTESHLDPVLARSIQRLVVGAGGRLVLIRAARRHADVRPRREPFVAIAHSVAERSWLLTGRIDDADVLLQLDQAALSAGNMADVLRSLPMLEVTNRPLLLVCTNGRRDVCCAVFGRPVAHDAGTQRPGQVWETSHTGGHRFSPTAVLLPWGITLARLDSRLAVATLDAAANGTLPRDVLGADHDRGRSSLTSPAQAAESAVRAMIHETTIEALRSQVRRTSEATWEARVHHHDGRSWRALVSRGASTGSRSTACGRAPEPYAPFDIELRD